MDGRLGDGGAGQNEVASAPSRLSAWVYAALMAFVVWALGLVSDDQSFHYLITEHLPSELSRPTALGVAVMGMTLLRVLSLVVFCVVTDRAARNGTGRARWVLGTAAFCSAAWVFRPLGPPSLQIPALAVIVMASTAVSVAATAGLASAARTVAAAGVVAAAATTAREAARAASELSPVFLGADLSHFNVATRVGAGVAIACAAAVCLMVEPARAAGPERTLAGFLKSRAFWAMVAVAFCLRLAQQISHNALGRQMAQWPREQIPVFVMLRATFVVYALTAVAYAIGSRYLRLRTLLMVSLAMAAAASVAERLMLRDALPPLWPYWGLRDFERACGDAAELHLIFFLAPAGHEALVIALASLASALAAPVALLPLVGPFQHHRAVVLASYLAALAALKLLNVAGAPAPLSRDARPGSRLPEAQGPTS